MHSQRLNRISYQGEKKEFKELIQDKLDAMSSQTPEVFTIKDSNKDKPHLGIEKWLSYPELKQITLVLKAVNNDTRLGMLGLLEQNGMMTITDINLKLQLEQSVVSQHLGVLSKAGIVDSKKKGKYDYYTLNRRRLNLLSDFIENIDPAK